MNPPFVSICSLSVPWIVFEKLRFRPSTRKREAGVFKNPHSGVRFRWPFSPDTCGWKAKPEKRKSPVPTLHFNALLFIPSLICSLEQLLLFHSICWQFHGSNFDKRLDTAPFNVNFYLLLKSDRRFFFLLVLVLHKFTWVFFWLYMHLPLLSLVPGYFYLWQLHNWNK